MKQFELLIDEKLVLTQLEVLNNYDAIEKLGNILYVEGYVKDTFTDAVIKREKEYPTGIQGIEFNIAIPHVDNCHVKKPGIAIGALKENVLFSRMDDPREKLDVKVIFLLAIKTPEYHLEALKEIMNLVQNAKAMNEICQCKNSKEIIKIIKREGE